MDTKRWNEFTRNWEDTMKLGSLGLIVALVLGILSVPLTAEAQQPGRPYRIGILHESFWATW